MSFERLNSLLKELSSSQSYFSVQSQIEKHLVDQHLTGIEQEKFLRLCLRKFSDWFSRTPDQIKEIKIHFHTCLLRTSLGFQHAQLIDLLINELTNQFNDYFLFLLTDFYQTHRRNLFEELERQKNVSYLVHLLDRISNLCGKNIPLCFQSEIYFRQISEYIEQQLINIHYPNMLAQIDTNVQFLSQLVHKAAKLGKSHILPNHSSHWIFQVIRNTSGVRYYEIYFFKNLVKILSGYV